MSIPIENLFSIVIPVKEIDKYTIVAIDKIHSLYPKIKIYIIADKVNSFSNKQVYQIKAESRNIAAKRNQGVNLSTTPYIAFIDSDAYPISGWLEAAYNFLESNPDCALVGGPNLKYEYSEVKQEIPILAYQSFLINNEPSNLSSPKKVKIISSSNLAIRKQVFLNVGGMNTNIYTGEDIELCYKVVKQMHDIYFLPKMKVRHKQRSFKGFLRQRFIWGRGVLTVLKYTFPYYISSLFPFLIILLALYLLTLKTFFFLLFIFIYSAACLIESFRVSKNLYNTLRVFPFIFSSLITIGLGTFYSIFFGDINNNYSNYKNFE